MQCEELISYLSDYIDHNLDEALTKEAEEHLATCHNCRVVLNTTQKTLLLYRQHGQVTMKPVRREKMFQRLEQAFLNKPENCD